MKTILLVLLFLLCVLSMQAQITSQQMKAGFGIDGELRSNYFNGISQSGNDDWFSNGFGSGQFVIDTTGASAIIAQYNADPNSRKIPFYRKMRIDPYLLMNNFRVIDAVFIRDYHGSDSTMFASGSNKNGMSPAEWTCPVAQSIPDKNEILDMMVHVRRAGPNSTDSLWMFGGVSIENTVGNRYFDFEMYQTDIYYDRVSRKFYGYGSDAGHTSWLFDASGNVTRPGDIIFSAEYSSSFVLSNIEARIWVHQSALALTPVSFNWTGSFDGASGGSQYGYATISPKTAGAFYTGLSSASGAWAGPFSLVKGDNSLSSTYIAGQFMEFSVNLSKLGLDPVTLLGGDECGMPFRRILVKSRSSVQFTAELKDFVGPFDFFLAPRAQVEADVPYYCGIMGVSQLQVVNPISTSHYTWTTPNGNIIGSTTGSATTVNYPGTYILTQRLQAGCSTYATDTVVVTFDAGCMLLEFDLLDFRANVKHKIVNLDWAVENKHGIKYFEVQRSTNGIDFKTIHIVNSISSSENKVAYNTIDDISNLNVPSVYYRIKLTLFDSQSKYSKILQLKIGESERTMIRISPNPVKESIQINVNALRHSSVKVFIYDLSGRMMRNFETNVQKGNSYISIADVNNWPKSIYQVRMSVGNETFNERIVLAR